MHKYTLTEGVHVLTVYVCMKSKRQSQTVEIMNAIKQLEKTLLCTLTFHTLSPSSQVMDVEGVKFILCRNILCHEASTKAFGCEVWSDLQLLTLLDVYWVGPDTTSTRQPLHRGGEVGT